MGITYDVLITVPMILQLKSGYIKGFIPYLTN